MLYENKVSAPIAADLLITKAEKLNYSTLIESEISRLDFHFNDFK